MSAEYQVVSGSGRVVFGPDTYTKALAERDTLNREYKRAKLSDSFSVEPVEDEA